MFSRVTDEVDGLGDIKGHENGTFPVKAYRLPLPGGAGRALRSSARPRQLPVYLETVGPRSLEVTGEIADGRIASSFITEHADVFFQHIAAGPRKASGDLADLNLKQRVLLRSRTTSTSPLPSSARG